MIHILKESTLYVCLRKNIFAWVAMGMFITALCAPEAAWCNGDDEGYEEISITLIVQHIGSIEIPSLITDQTVYLPVKDIFDFLKIKTNPVVNRDYLEGYFINPQAVYIIDNEHSTITYNKNVFGLKPGDLILTETDLYLKSDYFEQVFGLKCAFNFRSLSVTVTTSVELPAVREIQHELMRRNISKLKGERKADTTIGRKFSLFNVGTADWSVLASQETNGNSNTRLNLGLGAIIAGGEANVFLNYASGYQTNQSKQYYNWRYVNNDHALLRQVSLGNIFTNTISTLTGPLRGVQFSNSPTTYRKSFGTYTLYNTTEPGWMVELYLNNILINYVRADPSGFFSFQVPIVYGSSIVKLRFYGPLGEERVREQYFNIPFNFLPKKQFEYTVTGGVVDDLNKSRFSRTDLNYGLNNFMTIGTGMEYLSSLESRKTMPFVNTSVQIGTRLMLSGEHAFGVRTKGVLSVRLPSNMQLDVDYIKYVRGQRAIRYNYLEEKKAVLSIPFHTRKFTAFTRLSYSELTLPKFKFHTAEFLFSTIVSGVSSNLTVYGMFAGTNRPFVYTNLSLAFRLPKGIRFTPQAQYELRQHKFTMLKAEVEKNISDNGYLNVTYEKYAETHSQYLGIGARFNFSFAQTALGVRKGYKSVITSETARGSFIYNGKSNKVWAKNVGNVGNGALMIVPYLDLNSNNKRDRNEPRCFGLSLRISGGRVEYKLKDTSILITGLAAYEKYFIELNKDGFENISWQLKKGSLSITIEPNHVKLIEVPVFVAGEVSGTVYVEKAGIKEGLDHIAINIYSDDSKLVARTVSEADGYFNYMGLAPGKYYASIDTAAYDKQAMTSSPPSVPFTIKSGAEGDVVEGIEFTLKIK